MLEIVPLTDNLAFFFLARFFSREHKKLISLTVKSRNMYPIPVIYFCLFLPFSYAWTTTVSFQTYLELLERNPIGLPGVPLIDQFSTRRDYPGRFGLTTSTDQRRTYTWQIYPNANIAPNNRPGELSSTAPNLLQPYFRPFYLAVGKCTNIPPGTCCRTLTPFVTNGQFLNLPLGAISAFWGPGEGSTSVNGCEEQVLDSHYGAPQWKWQNPAFPPGVSGASYILCPTGTIGRGWGTALAGFCARLKRDSDSVATPAWVWPDLITVDGVNYTDDKKGTLLYYDDHNNLINLTSII